MSSIYRELNQKFKFADTLSRLIFVNVGVYLFFVLSNLLGKLILGPSEGNIVELYFYPYLALNSELSALLLKPWTLFTHLFVHSLSPWHIIGNMLYLYFLGKIFLQYFSQKQLLALYFIGGLIGAVILIITVNLSPYFSSNVTAVGASAAVFAIIAAVGVYAPKKEVLLFGILSVQLQWIAIALILSDIIFFDGHNSGGSIAHLGGAGAGIWFAYSYKKGVDITKRTNLLLDKVVSLFTRSSRSKLKVTHSQVRTMSDEEYNYVQKATQEEIDEILDKINKKGYESLSKAEKKILFEFSKK